MLISIVIATYNRSKDLVLTLDSLLKQQEDGSFEFEVIIIDNHSTDDTKATVEGEFSKWNGRLKYFFEPNKGKSYALNTGVSKAKGEIIAFTDDDVIVDPLWLLNTLKCFQTYSCDGLGGRVLPEYPPDTPQWIKDNGIKLAGAVVIYDYGPQIMKLNASMYPFIGANYAFKRAVFRDCGPFRIDLGPGTPTMGEDTEFTQRLLAKGKVLYYCGQALVMHPFDPKRMDLNHMAKWHIALGKFDAQREIKQGQIFVYFFAVPRYLLKGVVVDFLSLGVNYFNRLEFFNSWRALYRKVGMIQEYRRHSRKDIR